MRSRFHLATAVLTGLMIGLANPALALQPAAESAQQDQSGSLESCVRNEGGSTLADANCYVRYRLSLVEIHAEVLQRIYKALERSAPDATDYPRAAASLRTAEEHWQSFVSADCAVIDDVFGAGTALGLAGEDCVIRHYEARNQDLLRLEEGYLQP